MSPPLRAYWLGRQGYRAAWELQRALVESVRDGRQPDTLLLLEHDPVFTIGRRGDGSSLLWTAGECERRGIDVVWVDRGGDATYHGPGQLVGYPIVDLPRIGSDLLRHVRGLEAALIAQLADLGVAASAGGPGLTGVWAGGAKVAAIGVRFHQRITSHGFALNLTADLDVFNGGIVPCGLSGRRATSVLALGGPAVTVEQAARDHLPHFAGAFGLQVEFADPAEVRRWSAHESPEAAGLRLP